MIKKHGDLLAGMGALWWAAIALLWLPELGKIVSWEAAAVFAVAAMGRWYAHVTAVAGAPKTINNDITPKVDRDE